MNRELELGRPEKHRNRRETTDIGGDDSATVGVVAHTDPERHAREIYGTPSPQLNLVAHTSEFEAGDFVTRDVVGAPVILVRDDGKARLPQRLSAPGRHCRAARKGHRKRFVCPYHAWTYDRDGSSRRSASREASCP